MGEVDQSKFRIVSLQVSKHEQSRAIFSMTQHWGYWDSEDEAVGAAMRRVGELKPGFSVDAHLVASPFAETDAIRSAMEGE